MKYFLDVLKYKYADFNGRARRAEYWFFLLFAFVVAPLAIQLVIALPATLLHLPTLGVGAVLIYYLAMIVPMLAVTVRRMHDTDKDWWYMLIPIYGLILRFTDGTHGPNQYGPDPKAAQATSRLDSAAMLDSLGKHTPPESY